MLTPGSHLPTNQVIPHHRTVLVASHPVDSVGVAFCGLSPSRFTITRVAQVLKMVQNENLVGQSIIAYLQKKGYPEVALHFVKDERTRFRLALECGNTDIALESAKILDDKESWQQLAAAALNQGNHEIVEVAYQRTKSFEKLSFLYLITGNTEKLKKMMKIAELRKDLSAQFHNALYVGDVEERVKVLRSVGQLPLAYLTAQTHGLTEVANELSEQLGEGAELPPVHESAKALIPPEPVVENQENWPLLRQTKGFFTGNVQSKATSAEKPGFGVAADGDEVDDDAWPDDDDDDLNLSGDDDEEGDGGSDDDDEEGGWSQDDDMDLGLDEEEAEGQDVSDYYAPPTKGVPVIQFWTQNSVLPADHAAAGAFESAIDLMSKQIGIVNFAPFKAAFMAAYTHAQAAIVGNPSTPSIGYGLNRNWKDATQGSKQWRGALPAVGFKLGTLSGPMLQGAYQAFAKGAF